MGHHGHDRHDDHHGYYGHGSHIPPDIDQSVRNFIRRHRTGLKIALLAGALLVVLLIAGVIWGLAWGAGHIKNYLAGKSVSAIPMRMEQQVGDAAFAQLRAQTRFVTDPAVLQPLKRLAEPLLFSLPDKSRKYSLYVSDSTEVNACALPGGYIVFNRGLFQRARNAEEIQGVLAHEIAHIELRHGLMQLAQNIGMTIALKQIFGGGENQYLDALVRDGAKLLSLKFSRDHERAADDAGWDLLQQAKVNPCGMLTFFESLKAEMGHASPSSGLLSTHPTPQERIIQLRQKQQSMTLKEGLYTSFDSEFAAIKKALTAIP